MQYKVFWCKVNKYYTDKWLSSSQLKDASGIFVASCVVTDSAKRKWIRFVKQNISKLPDGEKMYISGCGAFEMGKENDAFFSTYPELQSFSEKIVLLPEDPQEKKSFSVSSGKLEALKKKLPQSGIFTKKFVLIQGWCDSYCTFCLTVQKRGGHFYRDKEDILEEILTAQRNDVAEIVLTWVNLCAWGLENTNEVWKSRFAELLTYILEHTDIPRIRISSLWPEFIDDAVLKVFEHTRIYPHFHFSIQSGSDSVLKHMKRHYGAEYMNTLLKKTRAIKREDGVNISIWADIIVWFPGETEQDFIDTYHMVEKFQIGRLHAFPFSNHDFWEHVPAHFFKDQVADSVKKQRFQKLLALWEKNRDAFIESQIGKTFEVLVEGKIHCDTWSGWTQNYIEADETNFQILEWSIKRGHLVKGILLRKSQKKTKEAEIN